MRSLFLGLVILGLFCCVVSGILLRVNEQGRETKVAFLDVGEGDAILISQGSNQILIDGGRDGKDLLYRLGRHMPFWDRQIETVIATHPDADHIGGFPDLFRSYHVADVLYSGAQNDTETSKLFQEAARVSAGKDPAEVFRGASLKLPDGGELVIEYPDGPLPKEMTDTNSGSIVARFIYGETSFLFTGDLPREETVLPNEPPVTVLKAAHHGSKYSTSDAFLDLVQPRDAVISVGKNMYGHPAPETIDRLMRRGVAVYRTDKVGDVVYSCGSGRCEKEE